ncbi:MAG: toprim domain-containing protein [Candidatus Cloacimonetes bacterium]|nr:toprim domain-containing protein [Candidatus Cloacimonadota bacterium]
MDKKTAGRLAWHIVSSDKSFALQLAENINKAAEAFRPCARCNMLSESDPCPFARLTSETRIAFASWSTARISRSSKNMNEYRGLYFVLGHLLSPIDGYGPDEINTPLLISRIDELQPKELILALKPSAEGEATMHYIWEILKDRGITITRLSTGLPLEEIWNTAHPAPSEAPGKGVTEYKRCSPASSKPPLRFWHLRLIRAISSSASAVLRSLMISSLAAALPATAYA